MDIVAEFGQGDMVGELNVITNSECTMMLHAIWDTELARMLLMLFNAISLWVVPSSGWSDWYHKVSAGIHRQQSST